MYSIPNKVLSRIRRNGRGWVFSAKDFLDLGSRAAVDQALSRLSRVGSVRRLRRGLYDFPRQSRRLGVLLPASDAVARAIAVKTNSKIQPSGALAANLLGVSTQVPARPVFLTDGPSKKVKIGSRTFVLRHRDPRYLKVDGAAGLALRTIKYLGKNGVDDGVIQKLRSTLSRQDRAKLQQSVIHFPSWMAPVVGRITQHAPA